MTKKEEKFLTVEEVAEKLRLHYQTVLEYIRSGKLPAIELGKGYRIRPEEFERFLRDRETSRTLYSIKEAESRMDEVLGESGFEKRQSVLLSAVFLPEVKVRSIFSHEEGTEDVIGLVEKPPSFRYGGWDLQTLSRAKPKGEFLEVKIEGIKTIRIFRNGQVVVTGLADKEFLGWALKDYETEVVSPINGMAVAEFVGNFCVFIAEILQFLDPKPKAAVFYIKINNPSNKKLSNYFPATPFRIPEKFGEDARFVKKSQKIETDLEKGEFNQAEIAAALWSEYCYIFGLRDEEIPYVKVEKGTRVMDFDTFVKWK